MGNLHPITAGYLKILEVVSVIMVAVGEKLDSLFSSQRLASEHLGRLRHQGPRRNDDDQRLDFHQRHSSSDSEPIDSGLPDYYFNQFDPRSPFYEPFPDSDDWHAPLHRSGHSSQHRSVRFQLRSSWQSDSLRLTRDLHQMLPIRLRHVIPVGGTNLLESVV